MRCVLFRKALSAGAQAMGRSAAASSRLRLASRSPSVALGLGALESLEGVLGFVPTHGATSSGAAAAASGFQRLSG